MTKAAGTHFQNPKIALLSAVKKNAKELELQMLEEEKKYR